MKQSNDSISCCLRQKSDENITHADHNTEDDSPGNGAASGPKLAEVLKAMKAEGLIEKYRVMAYEE